jgi:hypothetical protein
MSKHLERDLDNLQQDLLALAASVEEAIHKAIRAPQERVPCTKSCPLAAR